MTDRPEISIYYHHLTTNTILPVRESSIKFSQWNEFIILWQSAFHENFTKSSSFTSVSNSFITNVELDRRGVVAICTEFHSLGIQNAKSKFFHQMMTGDWPRWATD